MKAITKTGLQCLREFLFDNPEFQPAYDIRDTLGEIGRRWRADRWGVGDVTNSIIALCQEHLLPVTNEDVYQLISELLLFEAAPRTVRYYAEIAAAFGQGDRERYSELPFSHFEFARLYRSPREALDAAMFRLDETGRVPSVDWLRMQLSGGVYQAASGEMPPPNFEESEPVRVYESAAPKAALMIKAPPMIQQLKNAVLFVRDRLDTIPTDADRRGRLLQALEMLIEVLSEY